MFNVFTVKPSKNPRNPHFWFWIKQN